MSTGFGQSEDLLNQLYLRHLLRQAGAALEFADGAVQDLVQEAAREGFNGLALLDRQAG